jgi:hypothetical protein
MLRGYYLCLEIEANDKTLIPGYEVDIAIPSLRLAIEWNGGVHHKPIYGEEKLAIIQKRDEEKRRLAASLGIHLVAISDLVSTDQYVVQMFNVLRLVIDRLL